MTEFKVPEPYEMERFDQYIRRAMAEFERWVNQHYKPEERDAHR